MEWSARVEWSTPDRYDLDQLDDLVTALAEHHVAISAEKTPADVAPTFAAIITFDAGDLRAAIARGLHVVETAVGHPAVGIEIQPTRIRDHRLNAGPERYCDGGDIDLDEEVVLLKDGTRLTEARAEELAAEMLTPEAVERARRRRLEE